MIMYSLNAKYFEKVMLYFGLCLSFTRQCCGKKYFENIVGKGENAGNQHFLLFPQYFLYHKRQV